MYFSEVECVSAVGARGHPNEKARVGIPSKEKFLRLLSYFDSYADTSQPYFNQ
jgi:hypothetical protein